MARDQQAVLEKVRKLLGLAQSPNVHEAAAAAARAQALIEEHRLQGLLDEEEEQEELTDGREAPLEVSRRLRRWKTVLATGLAKVNGCTAYTARIGKDTHLLLAGRDEDRQAAAAMWPWLVQQIEWLSATHGAGRDRSWHNAFRVGAAEVVARRLGEAQVEVHRALVTTELARVEPALEARQQAVDRFVEETLRLRAGRRVRVDAEGYERGRRAGGQMPLHGAPTGRTKGA